VPFSNLQWSRRRNRENHERTRAERPLQTRRFRETAMRGYIQARHLISCAPTLVREFGLRKYLRLVALAIRKPGATFLQAVVLTKKS
jgi:hypothetical protein